MPEQHDLSHQGDDRRPWKALIEPAVGHHAGEHFSKEIGLDWILVERTQINLMSFGWAIELFLMELLCCEAFLSEDGVGFERTLRVKVPVPELLIVFELREELLKHLSEKLVVEPKTPFKV